MNIDIVYIYIYNIVQGEDGLPGIHGPPALPGLEVKNKTIMLSFSIRFYLQLLNNAIDFNNYCQIVFFPLLHFQGPAGEMGLQGPSGPTGSPVSMWSYSIND